MDCQIYLDGDNVTSEIIQYSRQQSLCTSIGSFNLTVKGTSTHDYSPGGEIVIYEGGVKKGTYFIGVNEKQINQGKTFVVSGQDNSKRIQEWFVTESYTINYPSSSKYWIQKFLDEAGVNYTFTTSEVGTNMSNNCVIGMSTAYDIILPLLQQNGWFLKFDADGDAIIGKLYINVDSTAVDLDDTVILDVQVSTDDRMLRNRAIVWGNSNPFTQDHVYALQDRKTGYETSSQDIRPIVLSNTYIYDNETAYELASQMLDEFAQLTEVKTIQAAGVYDAEYGDTIYVNSMGWEGFGIVTNLQVDMSKSGLTTTFTLDQRCPRIVAYFGSRYVYVGTEGNGVWRKPIDYPESNWEDYSAGLVYKNIQDLKIYKGKFACIANRKAYVRTTKTNWVLISPGTFTDSVTGSTYSSNEVVAAGISINRKTGDVYILYTNQVANKSWATTVTSTGRVVSKTHVLTQQGKNIRGFDIDVFKSKKVLTGVIPYDYYDQHLNLENAMWYSVSEVGFPILVGNTIYIITAFGVSNTFISPGNYQHIVSNVSFKKTELSATGWTDTADSITVGTLSEKVPASDNISFYNNEIFLASHTNDGKAIFYMHDILKTKLYSFQVDFVNKTFSEGVYDNSGIVSGTTYLKSEDIGDGVFRSRAYNILTKTLIKTLSFNFRSLAVKHAGCFWDAHYEIEAGTRNVYAYYYNSITGSEARVFINSTPADVNIAPSVNYVSSQLSYMLFTLDSVGYMVTMPGGSVQSGAAVTGTDRTAFIGTSNSLDKYFYNKLKNFTTIGGITFNLGLNDDGYKSFEANDSYGGGAGTLYQHDLTTDTRTQIPWLYWELYYPTPYYTFFTGDVQMARIDSNALIIWVQNSALIPRFLILLDPSRFGSPLTGGGYVTLMERTDNYEVVDYLPGPCVLEISQEAPIMTYALPWTSDLLSGYGLSGVLSSGMVMSGELVNNFRLSFYGTSGTFYNPSGVSFTSIQYSGAAIKFIHDARTLYYGAYGDKEFEYVAIANNDFLSTDTAFSGEFMPILSSSTGLPSGIVRKIETANFETLYFAANSGTTFYEYIPYITSGYFVDGTTNLPSGFPITIIRLDDRI